MVKILALFLFGIVNLSALTADANGYYWPIPSYVAYTNESTYAKYKYSSSTMLWCDIWFADGARIGQERYYNSYTYGIIINPTTGAASFQAYTYGPGFIQSGATATQRYGTCKASSYALSLGQNIAAYLKSVGATGLNTTNLASFGAAANLDTTNDNMPSVVPPTPPPFMDLSTFKIDKGIDYDGDGYTYNDPSPLGPLNQLNDLAQQAWVQSADYTVYDTSEGPELTFVLECDTVQAENGVYRPSYTQIYRFNPATGRWEVKPTSLAMSSDGVALGYTSGYHVDLDLTSHGGDYLDSYNYDFTSQAPMHADSSYWQGLTGQAGTWLNSATQIWKATNAPAVAPTAGNITTPSVTSWLTQIPEIANNVITYLQTSGTSKPESVGAVSGQQSSTYNNTNSTVTQVAAGSTSQATDVLQLQEIQKILNAQYDLSVKAYRAQASSNDQFGVIYTAQVAAANATNTNLNAIMKQQAAIQVENSNLARQALNEAEKQTEMLQKILDKPAGSSSGGGSVTVDLGPSGAGSTPGALTVGTGATVTNPAISSGFNAFKPTSQAGHSVTFTMPIPGHTSQFSFNSMPEPGSALDVVRLLVRGFVYMVMSYFFLAKLFAALKYY